jgi:hypothetical protein
MNRCILSETSDRKRSLQNSHLFSCKKDIKNVYFLIKKEVFKSFLMVRGLSQRPNLTKGPAATWDFRRSTKEEEEEVFKRHRKRFCFKVVDTFKSTTENLSTLSHYLVPRVNVIEHYYWRIFNCFLRKKSGNFIKSQYCDFFLSKQSCNIFF